MKLYFILIISAFLLSVKKSYSKTFNLYDCDSCVELSITDINEYWINSTGGINKRGFYLGNTIISLDVNSKIITRHDYGSIHLSMQNSRGNPQSQNNLMTYDTISSIENFNSTKMYELYFYKDYDNFGFKFGKIDFSSLFGVDDITQKFINGGTVTSTVMNNNSYYQNNFTPIASPGFYFYYKIKSFDINFGISSDNPYKEDYNNSNYPNINTDKHGMDFNFTSPFLYYELHYKNKIFNHEYNLYIGGFYDSGKQPVSYTNKHYKRNYGFYINYNQNIISNKKYDLYFFSRFYIDPEEKYENVHYTLDSGLLLEFKKYYIGMSFSDTNGSKYLNYNLTKNISNNHNEYKIELTLNYQLTKYFSIQPDIQYILRPGGLIYNNKIIKNELIFGLRSSFTY